MVCPRLSSLPSARLRLDVGSHSLASVVAPHPPVFVSQLPPAVSPCPGRSLGEENPGVSVTAGAPAQQVRSTLGFVPLGVYSACWGATHAGGQRLLGAPAQLVGSTLQPVYEQAQRACMNHSVQYSTLDAI